MMKNFLSKKTFNYWSCDAVKLWMLVADEKNGGLKQRGKNGATDLKERDVNVAEYRASVSYIEIR